MNLIQIRECVKQGKNIIYYNKDIYHCYNELKDDYLSVYFNEPVPAKVRLINIIKAISRTKKPSLNRLTIAELLNMLIAELKFKKLIILFNHFERLTKRSVQVYQYLNSLKNVIFICSFNKKFPQTVYSFFKTFEFMNEEEYSLEIGEKDINITYTVYALITVVGILFYIKITPSFSLATMLIGGAWFALIIFRTLIYVGGRI